ncbi:MAG TPA: hypothetical protein VEX13_06550 [Chloroflexia bacterium]|nr:hypothetical protein [Chloroflexia bacterium]
MGEGSLGNNHTTDEPQRRQHAGREAEYSGQTNVEPGLDGLASPGYSLPHFAPSSMLGDPRLSGRGNGPLKASLILQAQRTYGNRATRSALRNAAQRMEHHAPAMTLQRKPPTEAYMNARRDEINEAHSEWKNPSQSDQQLLQQVIQEEQRMEGSSFVFYSAAGIKSYALHQVIKGIWNVQHENNPEQQVGPNAQFEFLRTPGSEVHEDVGRGPAAFLRNVLQEKAWSDHQDKQSLLSANLTFFGNTKSGGTEASYAMFKAGGLFDLFPDKMAEVISTQLAQQPVSPEQTMAVLAEVKHLGNRLEARPDLREMGVMYQIFVPKDRVGELAYISTTNGLPLDHQTANYIISAQKVQQAIKLERFDARSAEFTRTVLENAQNPDFWKTFKDGADPQARLLMRPEYFSRPNPFIHINTYRNIVAEVEGWIRDTIAQIGAILQWRKRSANQRPARADPRTSPNPDVRILAEIAGMLENSRYLRKLFEDRVMDVRIIANKTGQDLRDVKVDLEKRLANDQTERPALLQEVRQLLDNSPRLQQLANGQGIDRDVILSKDAQGLREALVELRALALT